MNPHQWHEFHIMSGDIRRKPFVIFGLLASPALVYVYLIYRYGFNFPFLDDYDTVLAHLLLPANEQLAHWFYPHNEHIHWILRATANLDAFLFGPVNLVHLMWVGAAFFLLLYLTLLFGIASWETPWIWIIPLPFLLFQPSYWGTMTWATTALHNFPGLFFAFLAFTLWRKPSWPHKSLALLLLISALFTHGFGAAALVSVLLWECHLLIQARGRHTGESSSVLWTRMAILMAVLAGWILLRFWQEGTSPMENVNLLPFLPASHFFTNFLGSCIHFLGAPWITLLALVELLLFAWLTYKGLARRNPELYFFMVYLFLCAVLTTLARSGIGPNQGLASRYRILSTLLLCTQYLGLISLYWKTWSLKRWVLPATLMAALLFYGSSLNVNLNNLEKIRIRLIEDQARWNRGEALLEYPDPDRTAHLLREAENAGLFNPGGP